MPEEVKNEYEGNKGLMSSMYANMSLSFKDGTFSLDVGVPNAPLQKGKYTQDGNKVTKKTDEDLANSVLSATAECEVGGKKCVLKMDLDANAGANAGDDLKGITIAITLKEKA